MAKTHRKKLNYSTFGQTGASLAPDALGKGRVPVGNAHGIAVVGRNQAPSGASSGAPATAKHRGKLANFGGKKAPPFGKGHKKARPHYTGGSGYTPGG